MNILHYMRILSCSTVALQIHHNHVHVTPCLPTELPLGAVSFRMQCQIAHKITLTCYSLMRLPNGNCHKHDQRKLLLITTL